ncbi:MAG TPA: hypothetical protein VHZ76_05640, partial [Gammaproteobacteria bacterium]|nr:hypothetical protein [Gammaproteobacteria bacterium]
MFGQQNANAVVVSQNKETIILPLGLLVDLNHMATGVEFIKLAALPGKLQPGARLSPAEIKQALPAILALDAKLMSGSITPIEFRLAVLDILKLTNVSDVEFDKAWNAMLG